MFPHGFFPINYFTGTYWAPSESGDIDVGYAGVFTFGLPDGPAHELDGGEILHACESEHRVE